MVAWDALPALLFCSFMGMQEVAADLGRLLCWGVLMGPATVTGWLAVLRSRDWEKRWEAWGLACQSLLYTSPYVVCTVLGMAQEEPALLFASCARMWWFALISLIPAVLALVLIGTARPSPRPPARDFWDDFRDEDEGLSCSPRA